MMSMDKLVLLSADVSILVFLLYVREGEKNATLLCDSTSSLQTLLAPYFAMAAVITIVSIIFNVIVYWRICSKAGYSGL